MAYTVIRTVANEDFAATEKVGAPVPTTFDAWDVLLNELDVYTESWADTDALLSYADAVKTAVHADQDRPGMVVMHDEDKNIVVLGVIEVGA